MILCVVAELSLLSARGVQTGLQAVQFLTHQQLQQGGLTDAVLAPMMVGPLASAVKVRVLDDRVGGS